MPTTKSKSGSPRPEPGNYENIQFRTDHSGGRIAIRPNQFLVSPISEPTSLRRKIAEALAATVGPDDPDIGPQAVLLLALGKAVLGGFEGELIHFLEAEAQSQGMKLEDLVPAEIIELWSETGGTIAQLDQYVQTVLVDQVWSALLDSSQSTTVGKHQLLQTTRDIDIIRLNRELESRGVSAQPNHVYFFDSLEMETTQPNFIAASPGYDHSKFFNPNFIAGFRFNPNFIAALTGQSGCCCPEGMSTGELQQQVRKLGARPADAPYPHQYHDSATMPDVGPETVEVHIVDVMSTLGSRGGRDTGEIAKAVPPNPADANGDGWIDPATGHGDFVTSIVRLHSGIDATLWHAASPLGAISDDCLHEALETVANSANDPETRKVLNLSLGGYNVDDRPNSLIADQIERMIRNNWLIVASAGNNASCRLTWPAALPGVVAVGAVGDCGPAWFSNYGPWVDASAAGVDVVAQYPRLADLPGDDARAIVVEDYEPPGTDPPPEDPLLASDFVTEWATWSGTSFAAPLVAAKLALELKKEPTETAKQAMRRALTTVIGNQDAARLPGYGTIVEGDLLWP
jgi:hypothetical protein